METAGTLSMAAGAAQVDTPTRSCTRVVVAGMPGPALLAVAETLAVLMRDPACPTNPVWVGRAQEIPKQAQLAGTCVVRMDYFDPTLVGQADCVIYAQRDLRDAVVACHRYAGLPADEQTARLLMQQVRLWEAAGALIISYENALSDPEACVRALVRRLGGAAVDLTALARGLRKALIAAGLATDRRHTLPRAFLTSLPMEVIGRIEREFGPWLVAHGYPCVALSPLWAGERDRIGARERIWREFVTVADECRRFTTAAAAAEPGIEAWRTVVNQVVDACASAGSFRFQQTAMELVCALCGPNAVTELARVALLERQHKVAEAAEQLGRSRVLADNVLAHEWRDRLDAPAMSGPSDVEAADVPAMTAGKTAAAPLPPVSVDAVETEETIRRLAGLVRGKTVGFLLHGSSASIFPKFVRTVPDGDVVWVTLNHFALLEERMLRPIGQAFSIVFCCADGEVERRLDDLVGFLLRPTPKLLITRPDHLQAHASRFEPHRADIALTKLPPIWPYPNSLTVFLRLLVQAGARRVVLFGSDGYLGDDDVSIHSYVGAEQFIREKRYSGILLDTLLFNAHMPRILARWRERLGATFPEILNCSPGTLIQAFPTIDYSQAIAALGGSEVAATPPAPPALVDLPASASEQDLESILEACRSAGRRGDLSSAREHALRALRLDPNRLTPFAQRVLQTGPAAIAAAFHLLTLTGGTVTGGEQVRCADLAREMRETKEALGEAQRSWDDWE